MFKKLLIIVFGFFAVLAFAGSAFAATSVRLEQPKSPTNQNNFNLVFVALDSDGNPVTVTCWKKGPSDSSPSQFNSITLSNGGNTDNCSVDSSVVNTNGSYSFYVVANGVQSNTVSVDYNTNGPGTPTDYSKSHATSCEYKISFKTADDGGKTVKVELYRSDNTSFNVDSGSRVQSMSIGSNTTATFTDNVPDCSKSYYYAIRAFDNSGNGSGVVGDSETHTINPTAAPTQGAIQVNSGSSSTSDNSVLGTATTTSPSGTPTEEAKKDVLGTSSKTSKEKSSSNSFNWGTMLFVTLGALVVLSVLLAIWKKRKHSR